MESVWFIVMCYRNRSRRYIKEGMGLKLSCNVLDKWCPTSDKVIRGTLRLVQLGGWGVFQCRQSDSFCHFEFSLFSPVMSKNCFHSFLPFENICFWRLNSNKLTGLGRVLEWQVIIHICHRSNPHLGAFNFREVRLRLSLYVMNSTIT